MCVTRWCSREQVDRLMTGPMQPQLILKCCLWAAVLSCYNSCKRGDHPHLTHGLTLSLILHAGAVARNAPRGVAKPGAGRRPGAQLVCSLSYWCKKETPRGKTMAFDIRKYRISCVDEDTEDTEKYRKKYKEIQWC